MPVYILREGNSSIFKIGRTKTFDIRRRNLNSGSSAGLRAFHVIQTEQSEGLEKFLHHMLRHRNVQRHGGEEFFEMLSENHMREVIARTEPMFQRSCSAKALVDPLERVECTSSCQKASQSDVDTLRQIRDIDLRLQEIEDEASFLRFEREMHESVLKARIGTAAGIDGIATWESKVTRNFSFSLFAEQEPETYRSVLARFPELDLKLFREADPDLYQEVMKRHKKLDIPTWRLQDRALYTRMQTTYFIPAVRRKLILLS